jgi:hypothetical protein
MKYLDKIAEFINNEMVKLSIQTKVVSITTDNEPAVVSACNKLIDIIFYFFGS